MVKALGVKVSVLPRLFEVVGSSVEFDDLDGMTLLGRPALRAARAPRAAEASIDVARRGARPDPARAPSDARDRAWPSSSPRRGPVLFRQRRIGRDGREFEMLKFRTMVDGADEQKAELARAERGRRPVQDRRGPADHPGRPLPAPLLARRAAAARERPAGRDEPRRPAAARARRGPPRRGLAAQAPPRCSPGMTGLWQVFGSRADPARGDGQDRLPVRRELVALARLKILLRTVPHVLLRRGL